MSEFAAVEHGRIARLAVALTAAGALLSASETHAIPENPAVVHAEQGLAPVSRRTPPEINEPPYKKDCLQMIEDGALVKTDECVDLKKLRKGEFQANTPPFPYNHSLCGKRGTPIGYVHTKNGQQQKMYDGLSGRLKWAIDNMIDDPVTGQLLDHAEDGVLLVADAGFGANGADYVENDQTQNKEAKDFFEICLSSTFEYYFDTPLKIRTAATHELSHAWLKDMQDLAASGKHPQIAKQIEHLTQLCQTDMRNQATEFWETKGDAALATMQALQDLRQYFKAKHHDKMYGVISEVMTRIKTKGFGNVAVERNKISGCELVGLRRLIGEAAEKRGIDLDAQDETFYDKYEHGWKTLIEVDESYRAFMLRKYAHVTESSIFRGFTGLGHAGDGLHEFVASTINTTQVNPNGVIRAVSELPAQRQAIAIKMLSAIYKLVLLDKPALATQLQLGKVIDHFRQAPPNTANTSGPGNPAKPPINPVRNSGFQPRRTTFSKRKTSKVPVYGAA